MLAWNAVGRSLAFVASIFVLGLSPSASAWALENSYSNRQPGGYGDFLLALPPGKGLSLASEFYYYRASFRDFDAFGEIDATTESFQETLTATWGHDRKIFGARLASSISIPVLHARETLNFVGTSDGEVDGRTDAADPYVVPLSMYWKSGRFRLNIYEGITVPLGTFDADSLANVSVGYWSFDTNVAVTWFRRRQGTEISAIFGHTYNTKNQDTDYHSGQELHFEAMLNQRLSGSVSVGVHGFHQRQITDDRGEGAFLGAFRAESAGFGPALQWSFRLGGYDVAVVTKWLHEVGATNRPRGENVYLNFSLE